MVHGEESNLLLGYHPLWDATRGCTSGERIEPPGKTTSGFGARGCKTVRGGPGVLSGSEDEPLLSSSLGCYQRLVPPERLGTS